MRIFEWVAPGLLFLAASAHAADAPSFADVRALLAAKCLVCHGNDAKELKGDYDLRTRAAAFRGGESGEPAIVPGQPEKSPLYKAITWDDAAQQMPPKENDRLTADQVALIRRWIAAGANWDETSTNESKAWNSSANGVRIATSGGQSADWDNRSYDPDAVWAYQPVKTPQPPKSNSQSLHPIDAFLLAALHAKGINGFAPPADKITLTRRLAIDLTGLPPTGDYHQDYGTLVES